MKVFQLHKSGCGLFQGTVPAFVWSGWGKS